MFDISTLEMSVILVIIVGAVSGVAVSLAVRKKPIKTKDPSMQVKSGVTEPSPEESSDLIDFSETVPDIKAQEESNETPNISPATVSVSHVSSFQATSEHEELAHDRDTAEPVAIETPAPAEPLPFFRTEVNPIQEFTQDSEYSKPSIQQITQATPATREEEHPSSIAVPTDSSAIENITPAPTFPVAPQPASFGGISTNPMASQVNSGAPRAYCVKCKSKKQIRDPTAVTMKNGRPALSGYCSDCGTRVFRIGKI